MTQTTFAEYSLEMTTQSRPEYSDITTEDELIKYTRTYAKQAVDEYDYDVNLDFLNEITVSKQFKRSAAKFMGQKVPGASIHIPIDWEKANDRFEPIDRFEDDLREFDLKLSWDAFKAWGEEMWQEAIRHELIHVEQAQAFGTSDHRADFKARARRRDAAVRCQQFTPYTYNFDCSECGETEYGRFQMCKEVEKIREGSFASECCGSELVVREQ
jgi:predicted SprT family Zn-dependent metalloprotease